MHVCSTTLQVSDKTWSSILRVSSTYVGHKFPPIKAIIWAGSVSPALADISTRYTITNKQTKNPLKSKKKSTNQISYRTDIYLLPKVISLHSALIIKQSNSHQKIKHQSLQLMTWPSIQWESHILLENLFPCCHQSFSPLLAQVFSFLVFICYLLLVINYK